MAWKKLTLLAVWGSALIAWIGVIGFYFTDPSVKGWTIAVTSAALVTEVAFWATAALLGLSLWESRKKVVAFLLRPFLRQ